MSVKQLKLIIISLVICFLSYNGNSVHNAEAASTTEEEKINRAKPKEINPFNRLHKKTKIKSKKIEGDGIHDFSGSGAKLLQNPDEAFLDMPKAKSGNSVDWVKAQDTGKIKPRNDLYDPDAEALVMELNIVREVKGSMPDVVFPHKQHTQVLDCTNCHPAIFIPQKGANQMSMAMNLIGQKCGVCHGKVAFPLSRCTSCHSKKKPQKELEKTKWKWP